jgi:hypothetical protein
LLRDNVLATGPLSNAIMKVCPSAILTVVGSAAEYGASVDGKLLSESDECRPTSHETDLNHWRRPIHRFASKAFMADSLQVYLVEIVLGANLISS